MLKATDANVEDDTDTALSMKPDGEPAAPLLTSAPVGRVEYDMDEQDDMWLEAYNIERKSHELEPITREVFEIALTKIEKEWHALEKRIPKPNPKPPQTHRPRSSSAAAVNGEPQVGEEQDSKCAICDDGDCENTNAIVFCDGCDLAVHQECYGVPFIPEGQWLCRKCQLIGRGIPTCIFCPTTDGAFKQTNSSKWAHLLMILKAYCDKHCPPDYTKENGVAQATRDAKRFYKKTMKGRIWADNQVVAHALAATHRHALTDHAPDESQMTGAKLSMMGDNKKGQPGKPIWKLPSGAPVIPRTVFDIVEMALSRFPFRKRKDFVSEACRYWTLKREARRGAALLKRLQLQMETFSSMELTRRNFAGMGPSGKTRLHRRIEFAETLLRDLEQLKDLSAKVVEREQLKLEAAELEQDFVDTCYFPVAKLFFPVVEKALALDKGVFYDGLVKLQSQLDVRFYTTTLAFAHDLCEVISVGINTEIKKVETADEELVATTLGKVSYEDPRQRKTLGKRILKAVQPQLETALRTEAEISSKPLDPLTKELEGMLEASIEFKSLSNDVVVDGDKTIDADHDVVMADASIEEITVANGHVEKIRAEEGGDVDAMEVDAIGEEDDGTYNIERKSHELEPITREVFEIALTKIEKEWHALEKRIPKPNPKPPQTHRPRSSSAAAVNGEPQVGEEQDSKCAICDDGDCENTNAIVFCDGCDLAVHQECYGVPFIPEGQWLCRKCQLIGRGIPTCIFCPTTDGAFKQTNSSKWAHLLMILKAYCDKHCPPDYTKENGVAQATRDAKRFYKKTMKGRIWADNQVVAHALAATHRHALTDHAPDESQMTGAKLSMMGDSKKGQPGKPIWKLPSGAPVIPRTVFDIVEMALSRFPFRKRKDFVSEACRYWTLKREARRGAALLKRLQLQMETFSSMELTRRNFAGMGPSGKTRLQRRIEFAETLLRDLEQLKDLSAKVVEREQLKLEAAELEQDFVDTCYFPVAKLFFPVVEKALALDKGVFYDGLVKLQSQLDVRFYTTTLAFAHDLCEVISVGINTEIKKVETADEELVATTLGKVSYEDPRQRKTLGKRILKAVQPQLETALRTEAEISSKPLDPLTKELEGMLEASIEFKSLSNDDGEKTIDADHDVVMADASIEEITVANGHVEKDRAEEGGDVDAMEVDAVGEEDDGSIEVATSNIDDKGKLPSSSSSVAGLEGNGKVAEQADAALTNGVAGASDTPPASDGYQSNSAPEQPAPPTPPQSIGSLGAQSNDPLSEGGLAWHLKDFKLRGTTILADQWPGRDAIRSLSEELSDMDDRELEGLGFDVDDSTITASPNGAAASSEVIVDTIVSKAKASTRVRKKTRSSTRRR
ncbi:NuA3 HAT complex component NTO1 like protein [Verticillium longisporum]|nr:NuA3 HAT complex component NTO1 like protein [Verticillium longisporum]